MARPRLAAFLSVFCLSLLSFTHAEEKGCTGHNAGKYYDLNGLQVGKDYTLKTAGGHEMVLSACKSVSHETWGLKVQDPALVGGFVRRDHGDFSIGQVNTTLSFSGRAGHPHLTLSSGSKCLDSNGKTIEALHGSTEIEFICDPSAGAGTPRLVAQLPPGGDDAACAFFFEWRTAAACATSEGVTFGGIIWFLFMSALILLGIYLVVGTLYNYFMLGLAGTDALPRFTLAGMLHHGSEAWGMAGEWWASGRGGGFNLSSSARGPVGLGGPGGFPASHGGRVPAERGAPRSFGGASDESSNGSAGGNPFVRTGTSVRKEQMHPQTNPASHQTQVMNPPSTAPQQNASHVPANMGAPMTPTPTAPGHGQQQQQQGGLNPASHQAQLMAGMPVPHLSSPSAPQTSSENATAYRDAPAPAPPTPGRQTFAVGDDEVEEGEDDAQEVQIADIRGRMDSAGPGGEGAIRL
ncbi:hypothetical protein DFH06DRAFT_1485893 [Mycena polygramma]|nr:hypothetical protein DFH06DRAFT_1485893 [Mycena polygramma]